MYIDGFLLPVPKKNVAKYVRIARRAGRTWKRYGALEYREAVGDDVNTKGMGVGFPKAIKAKPGEVPVFSWIVYKSRAHRDSVNKKVMNDPKMKEWMNAPDAMPFDWKRMAMGGFKVAVDM